MKHCILETLYAISVNQLGSAWLGSARLGSVRVLCHKIANIVHNSNVRDTVIWTMKCINTEARWVGLIHGMEWIRLGRSTNYNSEIIPLMDS